MKHVTFLVSLFLIILPIPFCLSADEPVSSLHLCKPTEPNLSKCWLRSVREVGLFLIKGSPSRNIPSCQRLYVSSYKINARTALIELKNLVFEGAHNVDILDVIHHEESSTIIFKVLFSEVHFKSDFVSRGRYADLSIAGDGNVSVVVENLIVVWKFNVEYFTEKETAYRNIDIHFIDVSYESIVVQQKDLIKDLEVVSTLEECIQDKTSAFNQHFLDLLKNTFVKRVSQYAMRAYNGLPVSNE